MSSVSRGSAWFTQDLLTGVQAAGTVLADSGAVAGDGNRVPTIVVSCSQALVSALQHRNVANDDTLFEWNVGGGAGTIQLHLDKPVNLLDGERLRIVTKTATTAGAQLQGMLGI